MWLDTPAAGALSVPREVWLDLFRAIDVMDTLGEPDLLEFSAETGHSSRALDNAADGFALTGVPWVLYHSAHGGSFTEVMEGVCSSGGDADTVSAMAGCLASLRLGPHAIPTWMIDDLVGRQSILAPDQWHPVHIERDLTQREEAYKRETRLRRSREFWKDVGLEGSADTSTETDPLAALQEADEFWTEEVPISSIEPSASDADTEPKGSPAQARGGATAEAERPPAKNGEQLGLFTNS
jgi:hypothetical protein